MASGNTPKNETSAPNFNGSAGKTSALADKGTGKGETGETPDSKDAR